MTSADQVAIDIRELLFRHSDALSMIGQGIALLADRIDAVLGRPIPAPNISIPPIEMPRIEVVGNGAEAGQAVAEAMGPALESMATMLGQVTEAVKTLEDRVARQPPTVTRGGGITPAQITQAFSSSSMNGLLTDIKRGITDDDIRFDYGSRTDGNPIRVGKAPAGTASATAAWTIQSFTYDASARPTLIGVTVNQVWA